MAKKSNYPPHEVHPITYIFVGFLLMIALAGVASTFNKSSQPQTFKSSATGIDCSRDVHCLPLGTNYRCSRGFCLRIAPTLRPCSISSCPSGYTKKIQRGRITSCNCRDRACSEIRLCIADRTWCNCNNLGMRNCRYGDFCDMTYSNRSCNLLDEVKCTDFDY